MKYYITTKPFILGKSTVKDACTGSTGSFYDALRQFERLKEHNSHCVLFSTDDKGDNLIELIYFERIAYTMNGEIMDEVETRQAIFNDLSALEYEVYRTFYASEEERSYIRDVRGSIKEGA